MNNFSLPSETDPRNHQRYYFHETLLRKVVVALLRPLLALIIDLRVE